MLGKALSLDVYFSNVVFLIKAHPDFSCHAEGVVVGEGGEGVVGGDRDEEEGEGVGGEQENEIHSAFHMFYSKVSIRGWGVGKFVTRRTYAPPLETRHFPFGNLVHCCPHSFLVGGFLPSPFERTLYR